MPKHIILVEDNKLDQQLITDMLTRQVECKFDIYASATEAWEKLQATEGEGKPDLIISAFKLPGISGMDLLKAVRGTEALQEVPFVLFSGMSSPGEMETLLPQSQTEFREKPFFVDAYEKMIADMARKWLGSTL